MLKDFNETYAHKLRESEYLATYLQACLSDGPETFYAGLRKAVQARDGGFTRLAQEIGMGRESLYKALGPSGNPSFRTIYRILQALGVCDLALYALHRAPATASGQ